MTSNVLPSAPPEEPMNPTLPSAPQHDFRMQKANEISAALNAEVSHYQAVAKKYKRAKKVTNWSAAGSTIISTAVSSASLASALSVVGLPVAILLGGVSCAFALASSGLIVTSKKLDSKIRKHQAILTRHRQRRNSLQTIFQSPCRQSITDREFQLIMDEFSQYNVIKEGIRAKLTQKPSQPDIEKIKKDVQSKMEAEFRKKMNAIAASN